MKEKFPDVRTVRTIAVTSGARGTGKSSMVVNMAAALQRIGRKVMIFDAGSPPGSSEILHAVPARYNLLHLFDRRLPLSEIIREDASGLKILSAGTHGSDLRVLDQWQRLRILNAFDRCTVDVDVLLIDTTAGFSENIAFFCIAAQEILVMASPEQASVLEACSLIRTLCSRYEENAFRLLVNKALNAGEAIDVFGRISRGVEDLSSVSLDYLGFLPFDEAVSEACRARRPFIERYPDRPASRRLFALAELLLKPPVRVKGTLQFFINSLLTAASDREDPSKLF